MNKIVFDNRFFNIKDTFSCGQLFRFKPYSGGYLVFAEDKCAFLYESGGFTIIEAEDERYFRHYFDLSRDYSAIYNAALNTGESVLVKAAELSKGVRILNQNPVEALYSFMISQNNNIPRIQSTIEKLCMAYGEKVGGTVEYYAFPTPENLKNVSVEDFKALGLGYRAEYLKELTAKILNGFDPLSLSFLPAAKLFDELMKLKGVGAKVANCVTLFGYHKTDSFPVDTWIKKYYTDDLKGTLTDIKKITDFFIGKYGDNAGYFQQYLFYYKRSLEKIL